MAPEQICPAIFTTGVIEQKWKIPILWHRIHDWGMRIMEKEAATASE